MRAQFTIDSGHGRHTETPAGHARRLTELIAELASAGLVSVAVSDEGDHVYVLTAQGQQTARAMAMSRDAHALVLLGALLGASGGPN